MERERIIQAVKKLHEGLVENTLYPSEIALVDCLLKWYEQNTQKGILEAALKWWEEEASHLTESVGDGDWDNVFDGDPQWVRDTRQILDNK